MEYRRYLLVFIFLTILICSIFLYSCSNSSCFGGSLGSDTSFHYKFNKDALDKTRQINLEGDDILVYLHIQKTGGASFGRHLVHNLDVDPPCECFPGVKRCRCFTKNNRIYLFSRHSTGWACGLHADWTELHDCVEEWFKSNDVISRTLRRLFFLCIKCFLYDVTNLYTIV